jgi:hypothetical protein
MPDVQTLTINLDDLDFDALEEIEATVGHPIYAELEARNPSIRTIRALILWSLRKSDPKMTWATMPDIRSLNVEMVQGTPAPLGRRQTRSHSPRSRPSSSSTE